MNSQLFLQDLQGLTEEQIKDHLINEYEAKKEDIEGLDILIAYESVGSWGCDSCSFYLLKNKESGDLFEVHGSHCSCYGFEGQFSPEKTDLNYLKSDKFSFSCGGYDRNDEQNIAKVKEFIKNID